MDKITVADLATECSVQSKVILSELKRLGLYVFSPSAPIDVSFAETIRKKIQVQRDQEQAKLAEAEKKREAEAAKRAPKKPVKAAETEEKEEKKVAKKAVKAAEIEKKAERKADKPKAVKKKAEPKEAKPAVKAAPPRKAKTAARQAAKVEAVQVETPPAPAMAPRKGRYHYNPETEQLEGIGQEAPPKPEEMVPAAAAMDAVVGTAETVPEIPQEVETSPVPEAVPETPEAPKEEPGIAVEAPAKIEEKHVPAPGTVAKKVVVRKTRSKILMRTSADAMVPTDTGRVLKTLREDRAAPVRFPTPPRHLKKKGAKPAVVHERVAKIPDLPQPPASPEDFKPIAITEGVTLKELAEKMEIKSKYIIQKLISKGILASINQTLDVDVATEVCAEFGFRAEVISFEQEAEAQQQVEDKVEDYAIRPPVVTIMGHVDHGKTSLLDAIRETNVTASEAGGITQHIGAYNVTIRDRSIVFLDTPGHEAFTLMRARGAQVTDIVVLVVAADDGVMPQTVEAIHHAKAANVPIVVAINKIDKPEAQVDRVKQAMADRGLLAEDWGGDTVTVTVSAKQKTNLDLLLEMILLVADMKELRANPKRLASGVVLEAKVDRGRGCVATVLVQNGTLRGSDSFVAGAVHGRVRALMNDRGGSIDEAGPSVPVEIQGLQDLPQAGDTFQVFDDATKARQVAEYRQQKIREQSLQKSARLSLQALYDQMTEGKVKELPLILRGDVQGSVEVLTEVLNKLSTEKVKVRILHSGAGAITETDVLLASASNAIVIGFNVRPEKKAQELADMEGVEIRPYTVIYNVANDIKNAMIGMLEYTTQEKYLGRAEVRDTFKVPKYGNIAGSYVVDGIIRRNAEVRLLRDNVVIHEGKIGSLRRFKDDASEVKSGYECGIGLEHFSDVKIGDVIEAYVIEKVKPTSL